MANPLDPRVLSRSRSNGCTGVISNPRGRRLERCDACGSLKDDRDALEQVAIWISGLQRLVHSARCALVDHEEYVAESPYEETGEAFVALAEALEPFVALEVRHEREPFPADGRCPRDGNPLRWVESIDVCRSLKLGSDGRWLVRGADEHVSDGVDQHAYCSQCLMEFELPLTLEYDPDDELPLASET